jgi:putative membrane protein
MNNKLSIYIIFILHIVGITGSLIPATSELTIGLTPINLIISSILLAGQSPTKKLLWFFIVSLVVGMTIEIVGVNTGWPFGTYTYGKVLGIKLFDVPLIIGVNWFMLSYALGMISSRITNKKWLAILIGATLMTALDTLIEQVAIKLDYWQWTGSEIPISNYISWWLVSAVILTVFSQLHFNKKNTLAIPLIISQVVYFLAIIIFY